MKGKKERGSGTYDDEKEEKDGKYRTERQGVEMNSLCLLFVCMCYVHDFMWTLQLMVGGEFIIILKLNMCSVRMPLPLRSSSSSILSLS